MILSQLGEKIMYCFLGFSISAEIRPGRRGGSRFYMLNTAGILYNYGKSDYTRSININTTDQQIQMYVNQSLFRSSGSALYIHVHVFDGHVFKWGKPDAHSHSLYNCWTTFLMESPDIYL